MLLYSWTGSTFNPPGYHHTPENQTRRASSRGPGNLKQHLLGGSVRPLSACLPHESTWGPGCHLGPAALLCEVLWPESSPRTQPADACPWKWDEKWARAVLRQKKPPQTGKLGSKCRYMPCWWSSNYFPEFPGVHNTLEKESGSESPPSPGSQQRSSALICLFAGLLFMLPAGWLRK